ncbi:MAG TPA: PEP-CTERM sorting domain-containing protein [Pseudomonadales bacterium]|nr:PEP-CTERM sorting domain-containing protein [Pseudomonadales bacterium]
MKKETFFEGTRGRLAFNLSLAAFGVLAFTSQGQAQNQTLSNGGSSASFNLGGTGTGTLGMNSWMVDNDPGVSQLDQQWFWYSVNTGSGWSGVQPINQLGAASLSGVSANGFTATYQNSTMAVQVIYSLEGTGSGTGGADLFETVNVLNLSGANIGVNFYQYGHFNLLQNNVNTVSIGGSLSGGYTFIQQTTMVGGNGIQESINQPYANFAEAGAPTSVMNDVTSGSQLNGTTAYGPADAAWALEWNSTVSPFGGNAGNVWNVLQDQNMSIVPTPEPSTIALIAMGLGALVMARRRSA